MGKFEVNEFENVTLNANVLLEFKKVIKDKFY